MRLNVAKIKELTVIIADNLEFLIKQYEWDWEDSKRNKKQKKSKRN
jgi:hypothetical protein